MTDKRGSTSRLANRFSPSSRWSAPAVLAGMWLASTVSGCFGLTEKDYNKPVGPPLGASGTAGGGGASDPGSGGSNAMAGSLGSSGNDGSGGSGNAGSVGAGGSVANGGSAGSGGKGGAGGAAGSAGSAGSAGGQDAGNPVCAKATDGTGTGLKGEYFPVMDLSGVAALTRTDLKVDFDWGTASPGAGIPIDKFSVRWTGMVQPRFTGKYTFFTTSDDGSRVFVDGKTVVDAFVDQSGNMENVGSADLVGGTKYSIKVEFYDNGGNAVVHMSWASDCQTKEIVPTTQLYP